MKLDTRKRMAADLLKVSPKRIKLDTEELESINEAITKQDIRDLVNTGVIKKLQKAGSSRGRARKISVQKSKGKRKGRGSRKGTKNARQSDKKTWMRSVRLQRAFLQELRKQNRISQESFKELYLKSKGGFFRSVRHIKIFMEERKILVKK